MKRRATFVLHVYGEPILFALEFMNVLLLFVVDVLDIDTNVDRSFSFHYIRLNFTSQHSSSRKSPLVEKNTGSQVK